jgi:hypothetical protein
MLGQLVVLVFVCEQGYVWAALKCCILLYVYVATEVYFFILMLLCVFGYWRHLNGRK